MYAPSVLDTTEEERDWRLGEREEDGEREEGGGMMDKSEIEG